jgi:hypothetical protein
MPQSHRQSQHQSQHQSLAAFIAEHRAAAKHPGADIRERWTTRIIARGLHQQGRAGAAAYLRDYGKVIALAIQAEITYCSGIAFGFWAKAYELTTGRSPDGETVDSQPQVPPAIPDTAPSIPELPPHLQPGRIITMQPVDAPRSRADYIADTRYLGQPKRDGSRIVVIATPGKVHYQGRSTALIQSVDPAFDAAFRAVASEQGAFVLDGELVFLDVAGGEHRTGSQAALGNAALGKPQGRVLCCIAVFMALYADGKDLAGADGWTRISMAVPIVSAVQSLLWAQGVDHLVLEAVPTAVTSTEKAALARKQQAEGREGEVWVRRDARYRGGKAADEDIVRTKYVEETEIVITGLTPTAVAGRPFGAIIVAEAQRDAAGTITGAGESIGKVGTGFDADDAQEIAALVAKHPAGVRILVRHQGRTEHGQLWHARFLSVVGPVSG